jgi:hypothetical protein
MANDTDQVVTACEAEWDKWKGDCSGFVKAVAKRLGMTLTGQANDLVDYLEQSPAWLNLGSNSGKAISRAADGYFVIGGLKAEPLGHVVVVVKSKAQPYPVAYWGRYGSVGKKRTTINWSWRHPDLPNVHFFARKP